MTTKGVYFRVGIFVLAAMALVVVAVFAFGVGLGGQRKATVVETYLDTSIQGLEAGSKVRNEGVEVGRVKRITFVDAVYDVSHEFMAEHGRWVLVRITLFNDALPSHLEQEWDEAVDAGLRIRIASSGLTGSKYLDLDILDPERNPVPQIEWEPRKPHLPSAPSTMAKIVETVEQLSRKLEAAPIGETVEDARALVEGLRDRTSELDVAGISERVETVLDDAHKLLQSPEIPVILTNLRDVSANTKALTARLETQTGGDELEATLANLKRASAELPAIMEQLDGTLRRVDHMLLDRQGDLARSTRDLRAILTDLRELMETGKQYPSWAVFGDPPAPTELEEQP